jgi:hypothetical protein
LPASSGAETAEIRPRFCAPCLREKGRRKKEEGRRKKKEERRKKKEEKRKKKEERRKKKEERRFAFHALQLR